MTLKSDILKLVVVQPGITDAELARLTGKRHQAVNQTTRGLAGTALLVRVQPLVGPIRNYLPKDAPDASAAPRKSKPPDPFIGEDDMKGTLRRWLESDGWHVEDALGRKHGIDLDARKGEIRRIIEVKGQGTLDAMRVNYFLGALGEILQRMNDAKAQYSIALPDHRQYRGLWERLPRLAKDRMRLTALFVTAAGGVEESS